MISKCFILYVLGCHVVLFHQIFELRLWISTNINVYAKVCKIILNLISIHNTFSFSAWKGPLKNMVVIDFARVLVKFREEP